MWLYVDNVGVDVTKILGNTFFSFSVVNRWNALDNETVTAPSVIAFKSRLSRIRDTWMGFFMDNSDKP